MNISSKTYQYVGILHIFFVEPNITFGGIICVF